MKSSTAPTVPPMSSANERVRSFANSCFVPGARCCTLLSSFRTRSRSPGAAGGNSFPAWPPGSAIRAWSFCFLSVFSVFSRLLMVFLQRFCLPEIDRNQGRLIYCRGIRDLQQYPLGGLLDRRPFKNNDTVHAVTWIQSAM